MIESSPTREFARVLITGYSGFIGKAVTSALMAAFPRSEFMGVTRTLPAEQPQLPLAVKAADLAILDDLKRALENFQPDAVVHCAGCAAGDFAKMVSGNVLVTGNVLEVLSAVAPRARFIHLASSAEYGPTISKNLVTESFPERPESAYGITKLAATHLVRAANVKGLVQATVLRISNAIGREMPAGTLWGRLQGHLQNAPEAELVLGPLDAYRDFIDVRDVGQAVVVALRHHASVGEIINAGSGKAVSVRDAVRRLFDVAGSPATLLESAPGSPRSESVPWHAVDVSKAARLLEWSTRYTLEDSFRYMLGTVEERALS